MSSEAQDKKGGINYIAIVGLIAGTLFIGSLLTVSITFCHSVMGIVSANSEIFDIDVALIIYRIITGI